jgi:hypothetical protein
MVVAFLGGLARTALDFALPPRCAGCGIIVEDVHCFAPIAGKTSISSAKAAA